MTSGVGVFYLYVNGKPMGEEVLKPGFTHYAKTIAGPVRHAAIFDGEEYDAREAEGFMNAPALGKAETNSEFAGGIFPSEGAEIYRREDLALSPVNAYTWQGVTDATDDAFGKIIVSRQFRKGGMIMRYTFGKNNGFVRYSPLCTFYGYRFISVTADREVRIRSVRSVPVTSIASRLETGRITTGNELVNKLISNTMWGLRSNYLSVPTDWLSYEPLESCSGRKDYVDENGNWHTRPEAIEYWNYLSGCYWLSDARMMADMAVASGRDASRYEAMASEAEKYVRERFLNSDGTFKTEILNTMQTPALFALKNGLVDGAAKDEMIRRLRENFASHDNCLQTGFLGTSILMPTLTENGMSDIAYELLFQRKNPSWLYSVDNGATTIWERWNSYMLDSGMGPQGMNSFNHYAYGCVCEWMWETMAGIATDTSAPGFSRIVMKPVPDKRLGFVKAEYASAAGMIKSHWRFDGDKWIWEFTVPKGAVADVTLPGQTRSKEYPSGNHKIIM